MKVKNIIFTILLLAGLIGCSIKTLYNQLDWILAGLVEDYINLTETQAPDVEQRIVGFLNWHRKTQLSFYSDDLKQVKVYTEAGLTVERVKEFFGLLDHRWITVKEKISPEIAAVMLTLSKKQIEHLLERIKAQNEEYIEEYIDSTQEERNERIAERLVENFERWVGDLTDEQEDMFWQWAEKFQPVHQERLGFRLAWQKALAETLISDLPAETRRKKLEELFLAPEKYQSTIYKEKLAYNRAQAAQLVVNTQLTAEQKTFLYARIDYYVKNFNEMAAEVPEESDISQ